MSHIYVIGYNPEDSTLITVKGKKQLEIVDYIFYDSFIHPNLFYYSNKAKWIPIANKKKGQIQDALKKISKEKRSTAFLLKGEPNTESIHSLFDPIQFPYEHIPGVSLSSMASQESRRRVFVLRSIDQAQKIIEDLSALKLNVIQCPMIEIQPNQKELKCISFSFIKPFTTLIFTSANGVNIFMRNLMDKGMDARVMANKKILAIGPKTYECLKSFGLLPDGMPDTYVAESILGLLNSNLHAEKILIPTAEGARQALPEELKARGAMVNVLKIYNNICPKLKPLVIQDYDLVVFTSSSTADHFFKSKLYRNQHIIAFCIGEITQQSVLKYISNNVYTSLKATSESLVECIKKYLLSKSC